MDSMGGNSSSGGVKLHKTLVCGHQLGRVLMASVDFNFGRALCGVLKRYPVVIEGLPR